MRVAVFRNGGVRSLEIRVRHHLEGRILRLSRRGGYLEGEYGSAVVRSTPGKTKRLTANPLTTKDVYRMLKLRLKDAGLPERLSADSCRVTRTTVLLTKGVLLDDVQYLAGLSSPERPSFTTGGRRVTRYIVERI